MLPEVLVLRVVKVFPQPQTTSVTTYSGWIPVFTDLVPSFRPPGPHVRGEPVPDSIQQCARPWNAPPRTGIPDLSVVIQLPLVARFRPLSATHLSLAEATCRLPSSPQDLSRGF